LAERKPPPETTAGIPLAPVYGPDSPGSAPAAVRSGRDLGQPGAFPFTRGIHATMYRGKPWTMRQYAGFGTAEESNRAYKFLLASDRRACRWRSTCRRRWGRDSDHPIARGEVGRTGVAISSIEDMHVLTDGIPLDEVSVSMTINATAATPARLHDRRWPTSAGSRAARCPGQSRTTSSRSTSRAGRTSIRLGPSLRLCADTFAFCQAEVPRWNTISISGYHIREAGQRRRPGGRVHARRRHRRTSRRAPAAGLAVDAFAPRLSFFFNAHANLLEEVAKFRAARRLWARIMRDPFGATDPRAQMLRFHAQTAGSTLTAEQPLNNVVRTTIEALAAVLGGAQSLHTNGYDEALALPTEASARVALRTQQILADEDQGVAARGIPYGGSYASRRWTSEIEARAAALDRGDRSTRRHAGRVEAGFPQQEIEASRVGASGAGRSRLSADRRRDRYADETATAARRRCTGWIDVPSATQIARVAGVRAAATEAKSAAARGCARAGHAREAET
jgi:methylmalonyl-CoA mutase N-terminal domain/subunit